MFLAYHRPHPAGALFSVEMYSCIKIFCGSRLGLCRGYLTYMLQKVTVFSKSQLKTQIGFENGLL
jgi:hypothetical protein